MKKCETNYHYFIYYESWICGVLWGHRLRIVVVKFISRLGVINSIAKPLRIYCDNTAVVFFFKNDKYSKGVKHMKLKYLVVKEAIQK